MELTFINPGIDYMIKNILEFQEEGTTDFWSGPLFYFYPTLDKAYAESLPVEEKFRYIEEHLRRAYPDCKKVIDEKIPLYAAWWQECKSQISDALSEAFDTDCTAILNDMKCNVTMNPIGPRFLKERAFDVFYLNSEKGAVGVAIHEIIHMVWFHVWNGLFQDSWDEYERPSLKWILSEMVVESIMKDERLCSVNPYFPRENGGCIYPYFFDMEAAGHPVLDVLDDMYRTGNIKDFMRDSYAWCLQHEHEIRAHIEKSERRG